MGSGVDASKGMVGVAVSVGVGFEVWDGTDSDAMFWLADSSSLSSFPTMA
jgi:hypothetical protein